MQNRATIFSTQLSRKAENLKYSAPHMLYLNVNVFSPLLWLTTLKFMSNVALTNLFLIIPAKLHKREGSEVTGFEKGVSG